MTRLFSNSIFTMFVSALAYAAVPVCLTFLDSGAIAGMPVLLTAMMVAMGLVLAPMTISWEKIRQLVSNQRVFWPATLQAALFVLSLYLFAKAAQGGNEILAILIMETWPILTAVIIGPLLARQFLKLNAREALWSVVALIGIAVLLTGREDLNLPDLFVVSDPKSTLLALGSMVCMAVSVALKARATEVLKHEHDIGPVLGYLVLQIFFLPLLPFALAFQLAGPGVSFGVQSLDGILVIAVVFVLTAIASILYSFGTLHLQRASDTFLWFFAPALSVLMLCAAKSIVPAFNELIGIALIVSSNLLMTFKADRGLSYRAALLTLLFTGTFCAYIPGSGQESYYELLSVISIFFVIILSFMISQFSQRNTSELEHLATIFNALDNRKGRHAKVIDELSSRIQDLQALRPVIMLRRRYWQAVRLLNALPESEETRNLKTQLDLYVASRSRGISFGQIFALSGCVYATLIVGLLARHTGWIHDLFITLYAPSMVFAFFTLLDLHFGRVGRHFRPAPFGRSTSTITRIFIDRVRLDHIIWSCVLLVFVAIVFTLIFIGYDDRFSLPQ